MEYALSYAIYNWKRKDPKDDIYIDNLEIFRNFTGLVDEDMFIIVHIAMVAYTGKLVTYTVNALDAV